MAGEKLPLWRMAGWYVLYSGAGCGLMYGALAILWRSGWQAPQEMLLDLLGVGGLGVMLASLVHGLWLLALPAALTGVAAAALRLSNNLRGRLLSALVWTGLAAGLCALLRQVGLDVPLLFNRLVAETLAAVLPWPGEKLAQLMAVPYAREETWGDYTGERGEDW
ncbi:hypothetical protein [Eikenella longinqua]|uniref:hypothetical protein n=1 Tax=Eikenella longinqua TaxID=1795827 RepID=UPI0012E8B9D4|nr:hypothetical protein [Eikenella longinqua]